jgi:VanZ family protein
MDDAPDPQATLEPQRAAPARRAVYSGRLAPAVRALGAVWIAVVLVVSLVPADRLPETHVSDKVEHFVTYGLLALWFSPIARRRWMLVAALIALGVAIEVLQPIVSTRTRELGDAIANSIGVLIGLGFATAGLERWPAWVERLVSRVR